MEITLSKLLEGKPTIIKGKEFLSTKDYVQKFIDEMSKFTDKFIVNVQEPTQLVVSTDGATTYNKVWIQAIMPNKIGDFNEIYHFVYGLDIRTPVYKVFRSYGPCAFNTEWLTINKIEGDNLPTYSIKDLMEYTNDVELKVKKMQTTFLNSDERHSLLGKLIEKAMFYEFNHVGGKAKLSTAMVIKAFESVYMDSSSDHYVGDKEESSVWNYYSAFTDLIKEDKDIINNFEKNYLVYLLFNEFINEGN